MRDLKDLQLKSNVPGAEQLNWSQKHAKVVRPQKPADNTQGMQRWQPGQMPVGGFRSVIPFEDGPYTTKQSRTSGGGKKVY